MVDTLRIKGKIAEKNKTIGEIAEKIPISRLTLGRQISNKRPMTIKVAMILMEELDISKEEFTEFFCL